jgi:hypothetical protein
VARAEAGWTGAAATAAFAGWPALLDTAAGPGARPADEPSATAAEPMPGVSFRSCLPEAAEPASADEAGPEARWFRGRLELL